MKKLIVLMLILCFAFAGMAHGSYFTSFEASEGYTDDVTLNGTQGWYIPAGADRGWTWSDDSHPLHPGHDPGPAPVAGSGSQYARNYGAYNVVGGDSNIEQALDATERVGSGRENAWVAEGSVLMSMRYTLSTYEGGFIRFGDNTAHTVAAKVGFFGNNFAYYDGGTLVQSTATLSIDTWYKFDVAMRCGGTGVIDTYDLTVSDTAGTEVFSAQDIEFVQDGIVDYISEIRLSNNRAHTIHTEWYNKGAVFFDDVSVQIPEPATMILLLGGTLGVVIKRKK